MENFIKVLMIFLICSVITPKAIAFDEIADELFEQKHKDEIFLTLANDENNETSLVKEDEILEKSQKKRLFNFDFDDDDDGSMDNADFDFEIFKIFDKEKTISEETLFGKIVNSDITRTDVMTFLLQDDLTFNYEKGPVSKIHMYGAYRGALNMMWDSNYSTDYDNNTTQFGVYGSLKNPDYKFKFAANPIPRKGLSYIDRFVSDAYVVNTSLPNHQFVAGYSRVQTSVEGGASTYVLPFVARSQIARNFSNVKSLSLKAIGNYQYLDYNLSLGSAGRYISSGLPGAEFNGWVNVKPFGNRSKKFGKLVVGGGFNGGHNRIDYAVATGYIGYHHKKLWTNFEASVADGYSGSNGISKNKAGGWAATLGWKFNPHFQLIGRIDQFDPNRSVSNDLRNEYTVGINWFIKGQALKVMLNYVFCDSQNSHDSHKIILATQLVL